MEPRVGEDEVVAIVNKYRKRFLHRLYCTGGSKYCIINEKRKEDSQIKMVGRKFSVQDTSGIRKLTDEEFKEFHDVNSACTSR